MSNTERINRRLAMLEARYAKYRARRHRRPGPAPVSFFEWLDLPWWRRFG